MTSSILGGMAHFCSTNTVVVSIKALPVTLAQNIHALTRFICRMYKQPENLFFKELLARKYETIDDHGLLLRFLEKWPTFPH